MSLKFNPKISYWANFYFFVQNLSEWHPSNRKKYNQEWRKFINLSGEEKNLLKKFKEIHEEFPFGNNYLGRPFFLFENPWQEVKRITGREKSGELEKIFLFFKPHFEKIYKKEFPTLKKWKKIISKPSFLKETYLINKTLANFYGCSLYDKPCVVYLLISTKTKNGGVAGTIDKDSVNLELSGIPTKLERLVSNILWHELTHLYFRNKKLKNLLLKYIKKEEDRKKVEELIASSLLPNGLLKLINKKNNLKLIEQIIPQKLNSRFSSPEIIDVQKNVAKYILNKKSVDEILIKNIIKIIKNKGSKDYL